MTNRNELTATIELYEPNHDHLKIKTKHGGLKAFVYVIKCGPFVRICPSERSAMKCLEGRGFRHSDDFSHFIYTHKSLEIENLERNYTKSI